MRVVLLLLRIKDFRVTAGRSLVKGTLSEKKFQIEVFDVRAATSYVQILEGKQLGRSPQVNHIRVS